MAHVSGAYRNVLAEAGHKVRTIYGDDAFSAKATGDKLGIVNRLVRPLKSMLNRSMLQDGFMKWGSLLADVMKLYHSPRTQVYLTTGVQTLCIRTSCFSTGYTQRTKRTMWK
jgi:hypothetical protein